MNAQDTAKGKIYYGMHFYPGVAEYAEKGRDPYRVFLNENTIRNMGPTFHGCPVFVYHVNDLEKNIDNLRSEADGWVIESFFNESDGKHWVKFIVVSDKGENAIRNGMRLSNCYIANNYSSGGTWNGVSYDKEVIGGTYEHLAIVPNPRYDESVILTPEQFKKYNEDKVNELKRLANDKPIEGENQMKFSFFKRAKVENSTDLEGLLVMLPKSKVEVSIEKLINEADEFESNKDKVKNANPEHMVEVSGEKMTVSKLIEKYENAKKMCDEDEEEEKKKKENEEDDDMDDEVENEDDDKDDKKDKKDMMKDKKENKKKKNDDDDLDFEADERRRNAKEKAERLKNADKKIENDDDGIQVSTSSRQLARGRSLYGSK